MFEEAWQQNQMRSRQVMVQQQQQQQAIARNMAAAGQMSPTKPMAPQAMQQSQQFLQQQQQQQMAQQLAQQSANSAKNMNSMQQPAVNGFSSQSPQAQPQHQPHLRNSLSRSLDSRPDGMPSQTPGPFPIPSPVSGVKHGSLSMSSPQVDATPVTPAIPADYNLPDELEPKIRVLDTFGGIDVESLARLGTQLAFHKPDIPPVHDLGVIDVHAITMSLQCGIPSEVRLALDTLVMLSAEPKIQLELKLCEDLVDTLVDCAEEQVEILAESAAEVSDVMLINSYEDVLRGCRSEQEVLQDIHPFASHEYELDRAVEKLIAITTIMRNLSFYETNHQLLADDSVIKFLCVVIRYLGTRNMLLRSYQNVLDFMKDVIVFLSNLAQTIELPGREQALCLLHFLLAFAPCPSPNAGSEVTFSPYDPAVHRYLPPALDSLAKLLARDEPNRTHYKTIFAADVSSTPPFDLLTKSFALAISPIPDDKHDAKRGSIGLLVEARKPILMQGMLAAEILSNLAPGFESGVAMSWLTSEDGFAQNLSRMVMSLVVEPPMQISNQRSQPVPKGMEDEALLRITTGGIAVLHRLAEKCKDPENPRSTIPLSGMPSEELLLGALEIRHPRMQGVLKQLCAYAGLAGLET